jgi:hypothetical protein
MGQARRDLSGELVPAVPLLDPGRAEDRDTFVDVPQRRESTFDLLVDAVDAAPVIAPLVDWDAQEMTVVPPAVGPFPHPARSFSFLGRHEAS